MVFHSESSLDSLLGCRSRTSVPPHLMTTHTPTFEALGVAPDLVSHLHAAGIRSPFAIQELTIRDGLAGRDVCGKAKTGSGKTLAFGIPLVERVTRARPGSPTGLVLVPTRELAKQVNGVLADLADARGLRVHPVYGGVSMDRQIDALERGVDVVVGTPGRIIDLIERRVLSMGAVEVLVLDEADRMADMGFMPQVQKILYRMDTPHQSMLFSATLDGAVKRLVDRYLDDPVYHEVVSDEPTVDEMEHRFLLVHKMDKVKVTAAIIRASHRVLVFTSTKRMADRLQSELRGEGVTVGVIHGDLRQGAREQSLQAFSAGKVPALVATDVAARGLHIDDVDVVVHYDPADDEKAYLHRSGRTARAGATGVAVTLMLWNEENIVRAVQRRLGLESPMVEMFSNDPRLGDLAAWRPDAVEVAS